MIHSLSRLLLLIIIMSVFNCQESSNIDRIIREEVDSLMTNKLFKAVSIGVVKNNNEFIHHSGNLLTKNQTDAPLFEIASLTKTFTGTLLAMAVTDNKLSLNDDIRMYLKDTFPNLEYDSKPITFKHLVTHTSGLPAMFPNRPKLFENPNMEKLPFQINELQGGYSRNDFLKELHRVTIDTIPGLKLTYSNVGANLVALCLENIYEKNFSDLLNEKLLEPLAMEDTYIDFSQNIKDRIAIGVNADGTMMPIRANKELNAEGGIVSTINDMLKYMAFHLKVDDEVVKVSHQELFDGKYGEYEAGLFWQILKPTNQPVKYFQNGGAFGTSSWMTLIPESKIGVFIVTTVSSPEAHQELSNTVDRIIDRINNLKS